MKAFLQHFVAVLFFVVSSKALSTQSEVLPSSSVLSSFVEPSPSIVYSTKPIESTALPYNSSTTHFSFSSLEPSLTSSIHPSDSSKYHNESSTIYYNQSSSIMPSPSVNYSMSINMTSASPNTSHMTHTVSPTHSLSPNKTSSVVPTTSSVIPTTSPTPQPKLPVGKFSLKNGKDTCLLMWLSLEISVKFNNASSGEMITFNKIMPNTSSAIATGSCENGMSTIRISWEYNFYYVEVTFSTNKALKARAVESHWVVQNLTFFAQVHNNSKFDGINANISEIKETLTDEPSVGWLHGVDGHSFACSKQQVLKSGNHISATFENLQIQPFDVKDGKFSKSVDKCNGQPPTSTPVTPTGKHSKKTSDSNTVAIAVGCSLGGLVLIVLVGYLIGKRRNSSVRYRKL